MASPAGPAGSVRDDIAELMSPSRKRPAQSEDQPRKSARVFSGRPLKLVKLNMEQQCVEVCEEALSELEANLRRVGTKKVAVVSVMGAFRTGKSFLLDLFLRYLRHEDQSGWAPATLDSSHRQAPLPAWATSSGGSIEGAAIGEGGFHFRGGMEACTEGIWVWSEPFRRTIHGEPVAVLLMDTQGAWDSGMTKEQSATIFGLTAVLSSRLIYNIDMQIQEDKVENLAYFMRFAQAALRKACSDLESSGAGQRGGQHGAPRKEDIDRPFQSLDFLVRNWRHFKDDWSLEKCREQMREHFAKHVDPDRVRERGTAEALHSMFSKIDGFCFPHPGFAVEKEGWKGGVRDISPDFLNFADAYIHEVFTDLETKRILGSELSSVTFPHVLRDFVHAFCDAAPAAMSFTQAMASSTIILAKEGALESYTRLMDEAMGGYPQGADTEEFDVVHRSCTAKVKTEFWCAPIFGSETTLEEAWQGVEENMKTLSNRFAQDNARKLDKMLNALAPLLLLGLGLFLLDRSTDWTCDWWSQTCCDISRVLMVGYVFIGAYVGVQIYQASQRKALSASVSVELWKEIMRLAFKLHGMAKETSLGDIPAIVSRQWTTVAAALMVATPSEEKKES